MTDTTAIRVARSALVRALVNSLKQGKKHDNVTELEAKIALYKACHDYNTLTHKTTRGSTECQTQS